MYIMRCRILCSICISLSIYSTNPIPIPITSSTSSSSTPPQPNQSTTNIVHSNPPKTPPQNLKSRQKSTISLPSLPPIQPHPEKNVPHPPNPLPLRAQRQHPNPMPRQPRKRFHTTLSSTWNSEYGSSAAGGGFA